ncbi:MAG: diguanylate cyclase domain-containing protein [Gemmatimonadota bacterium]
MPDAKTLSAALDAVDVGMALVGPDWLVQFCNVAYGETVGAAPEELIGSSIFADACPCESLAAQEASWDDGVLISVSGESPLGNMVDVVVRPVMPGSDVRLVVVQRAFVRAVTGRRLPPDVTTELHDIVAELTGHTTEQTALEAAPLSILMLGVEGIAALREQHGSEAVEPILREVAQVLVLQKRKADIISRYGDGQYLILAPETPRYGASMLAERIRRRVSALDITTGVGGPPVTLLTYASEYRPHLDGTVREAIARAAAATTTPR